MAVQAPNLPLDELVAAGMLVDRLTRLLEGLASAACDICTARFTAYKDHTKRPCKLAALAVRTIQIYHACCVLHCQVLLIIGGMAWHQAALDHANQCDWHAAAAVH